MTPEATKRKTRTAVGTITTTTSETSAVATLPEDLGIPHHMQDKKGFCGAACMMMLLGFRGIRKSQSELMRLIKEKREQKGFKEEKPKRESDRVAWHASPEEIAAVLNEVIAKAPNASSQFPWGAAKDLDATMIMTSIDVSLAGGEGAIALVWSANLDTKLPHWVVVCGSTPGVKSDDVTGYWILDPTAADRSGGTSRYESIGHELISESSEIKICPCQCWKDTSGREQTAQRIWVPKERLEELLDEGAVKGIGLRYAIVAGATEAEPSGGRLRIPRGAEMRDSLFRSSTTTVEKKIREKRTRAEAEIFASVLSASGILIRQPAENEPEQK